MENLKRFNNYYKLKMGNQFGYPNPHIYKLNEHQWYNIRYAITCGNKLRAVKLMKDYSSRLGLKDSKKLIDDIPFNILKPQSKFEKWLDMVNDELGAMYVSISSRLSYFKGRKYIRIVQNDSEERSGYNKLPWGFVVMDDIWNDRTKAQYQKGELVKSDNFGKPKYERENYYGNIFSGTDKWGVGGVGL